MKFHRETGNEAYVPCWKKDIVTNFIATFLSTDSNWEWSTALQGFSDKSQDNM